MRPTEDDTTIRLPVTFDYNGGRGDKRKGNILTAIIVAVITIIIMIGTLRNDNAETGAKIAYAVIEFLIGSLIIRFRIMHESTYSDAYETLKEINNIPSTDSFWSIYEVDSTYPYVCHYKDGKHGIFIRMEKDVVVGKPDDIAYLHYDAISEAYQLAGSLNMNMCQIDYMDNVGNDPRLRKLYESLSDCDNPDMKEMMLSIYSNLQEEMSQDYASFDVYVFTTRGNPKQLEYNVKLCVDRLLAGNYLTYKALDIEGIRTTCMAVLNLNEFSALEACSNIFKQTTFRGIVPIRVEHADSVEELNKTQEQLREEAAERARQEMEAKEAKKQKGINFIKNGFSTKPTESVEESSADAHEDVADEKKSEEQSSATSGDMDLFAEEDSVKADDASKSEDKVVTPSAENSDSKVEEETLSVSEEKDAVDIPSGTEEVAETSSEEKDKVDFGIDDEVLSIAQTFASDDEDGDTSPDILDDFNLFD